MAEMQCSRATVANLRRQAGISDRPGRKASAGRNATRHDARPILDKPATMPPVSHPALTEARTLYPSTVVPVDGLRNLLVSGQNSWKVGAVVTKGRWKGFPIFTLTLEERATCPTSCGHWRSCYGNAMHMANRIAHGPAFEERLGHELAILNSRHPGGFAVRLHILGDFYSAAYVDLWGGFLDRFPALHVFGFSARWNRTDPIARALLGLVMERWDRFAIRFSNAPSDECSTVSIEHPVQKPADAVICPAQLGKTDNCGTCGLCWATTRRIGFVRH
ncbi:MAG: hypothetical protein KIS96_11465 [Bauldia sp.]|nr:hypothetical protein [Bauldia sp.]